MDIKNIINLTGNDVTIMKTGYDIQPDWDTESKDIAIPVQYLVSIPRYGVNTVASGYRSEALKGVSYETVFLYADRETAEKYWVKDGIKKAYLKEAVGWDGEKELHGHEIMYI